MSKWTDEPGEFLKPKHEGDQGKWIGRHLRFDGRCWASTRVIVSLYREDGIPYKDHPTSHRLRVSVSKSLSAEQARQLARWRARQWASRLEGCQ